MMLSGEWFGAMALNAIRHRMGSRRAIDMVSARWWSLRLRNNAPLPEGKAPIGLTSSPTIAGDHLPGAAASLPA